MALLFTLLNWALAVFVLCGFHGCLNENVHRKTLPALSGQRIGYVDTRAGTGGVYWVAGHTSPAVQVPWGMVKLGPDTLAGGKHSGKAGYHFGDVQVQGFSHTRLVGADAYEGGILRVLPSNSILNFAQASAHLPTFSHRNETAVPGYYSVYIDKDLIQAELTSTARVGLHRYSFTQTNNPVVYLDLTSCLSRAGTVTSITATVNGAKDTVTGSFVLKDDFSSRYGGLKVYFEMHLATAATSYRFLTSSGESSTVPSGNPSKLFLELDFTGISTIEMRVALSYTGAAGATANYTAEAPLGVQSFDAIMASTQATWEAALGRVTVSTSKAADLQKFYTALYNSFRMPSLFGDYDAAQNENYFGFDGNSHTTAGFSYYTDFSLWDTFRTVHPLYLLVAQTENLQMLQSLLRMAQESGRFPRWAAGAGHADSMLGFPAAIVLSESYLKGQTGFGAAAAYALQAAQANAGSTLSGRECFDDYLNRGYCPSNIATTSVSYTLEYAYADAALSAWASALGNAADATAFGARAKNYGNLWNTDSQAFLPKDSSGNFLKNCRLEELSYLALNPCSAHYAEGSAVQYRWYAPAAADALVALFPTTALSTLQTLFQKAPQNIGTPFPSGYYWHGNEPGLASVIFFNHLQRPDLTQYWTDWIRRTKYDTTSVGLDGNDDGGTLSAWFVLSALGFLPVAGTSTYEIVSPLFESANVNIGGNTLVVTSTGATQGKIYVRSATLNGAALTSPQFTHSQIALGGILVLNMSATPGAWQ